MFLFSFITISNIRQTIPRQIQPIPLIIINQSVPIARQSQTFEKTEHLLLTLFIQVISLILFSLPQVIQSLYTNISRFQMRSSLQNATNNFMFHLFLLLTYVTNGIPLYLYTLSGGQVFRKALYYLIRNFIEVIACRRRWHSLL
ncbi:unnamed protein product [Rotaria socialis]|uniref:Uncharacterized protein n=1 Tax=Rotaria socialis TaxID=392032 RepID=A0A818BN71_9BILA|nr:unnamed protein product [Rotaria socialis]